MIDIDNYKTIVIRRTIKRTLAFLIISIFLCLLLPYFSVLCLLLIFYLIQRICRILKYDITLGEIIDVYLENYYDDPYTYAVIEFKIKLSNKIYKTTSVISHWGDYVEGCDEELNKMFEKDKKNIGKKIPVLYKKSEPDRNIVYFEDVFCE